jgi:hypothetical protein
MPSSALFTVDSLPFHPISSIFIHFHPFSSVFIHFHPFSSIPIHFHPFSSIFIHFHPFSSIFVAALFATAPASLQVNVPTKEALPVATVLPGN